MTRRQSVHGPWFACSTWPTCKGKMDIKEESGAAVPAKAKPARPPPLGVPHGAQPLSQWNVVASQLTLDAYQQQVVDHRHGWAVCVAAAGSGKTSVTIERTCRLVAEGVIPESICLLAYNASAAQLMRDRLSARMGVASKRVNTFTFHAWCYALLRHWYPEDHRLAPGRILGSFEAPHPVKLVGPLLDRLKLDLTWRGALESAERVGEALVRLDLPDAPQQVAITLKHLEPGEPMTPQVLLRITPILTFCRAWAELKRNDGYLDFVDMLCEVASAIHYYPELPHVAALTTMYRHVMVDEAQDISWPRALISHHLGVGAVSSLWVGDCRQSVYQFAGAKPKILIEMATAPNVAMLTLPVNRRSTKRIVQAANEVAAERDWNLGGACFPRPDAPEGEVVQVWTDTNSREEAGRVIEDIQRRMLAGLSLGHGEESNYCCLARTNALLVGLECAFVARNVPVRVAGSPGGIWASNVGTELLSYLEAVEGIPTWGITKIANQPKRFVRRADLATAIEQSIEREKQGQPAKLHDTLLALGLKTGAGRFGADLAKVAREPWGVRVLECARWLGMDEANEDDELASGDEDRSDALKALMGVAQQLGSLKAIYAHKRQLAKSEKQASVLLSTIHKAKGSEHPVVYVCGVQTGKLPHSKCEDIEEERRLLYVAVTRGKDVTIVSCGGKPSPFLSELGWIEVDEDGWVVDGEDE